VLDSRCSSSDESMPLALPRGSRFRDCPCALGGGVFRGGACSGGPIREGLLRRATPELTGHGVNHLAIARGSRQVQAGRKRTQQPSGWREVAMADQHERISELRQAVVDGDTEAVQRLVEEAIRDGADPRVILDEGLTAGAGSGRCAAQCTQAAQGPGTVPVFLGDVLAGGRLAPACAPAGCRVHTRRVRRAGARGQ
jgi:hypothetical protein